MKEKLGALLALAFLATSLFGCGDSMRTNGSTSNSQNPGGSTGSGDSGGSSAANTLYVDGSSGSDSNHCQSSQSACKTIGHAISLAISGDSIIVAAATYKENLTINVSLNISGAGAMTTVIDGGAVGTVVTINNYDSNTHVTLSGLTIRNGSSWSGGGIRATGVVAINNSSILGNIGPNGAGIHNDEGTLVINSSTISGNHAGDTICLKSCNGPTQGAGIYNFSYTKQASLTLNNSTVTGNDATSSKLPSVGGAIAGTGSISINNSTISGNSADSGGGIAANAVIQNSIVADNSGGNCSGTLISKGYNLSSDNTCNFTGPGDMNNTGPLLGPLQNNGGPTNTQSLLSGSPAIDADNPNGCTDGSGHLLRTDQRGKPRSDAEDTSGCDIGAYERQSD